MRISELGRVEYNVHNKYETSQQLLLSNIAKNGDLNFHLCSVTNHNPLGVVKKLHTFYKNIKSHKTQHFLYCNQKKKLAGRDLTEAMSHVV